MYVFSLATFTYLAAFLRWTPSANEVTASLLCVGDSTAWELPFRVYCYLRAALCSAIYGQDSQAVSPGNFLQVTLLHPGVFCAESWALGINNSLGNFQVPLFWGGDGFTGNYSATDLDILFTNICCGCNEITLLLLRASRIQSETTEWNEQNT